MSSQHWNVSKHYVVLHDDVLIFHSFFLSACVRRGDLEELAKGGMLVDGPQLARSARKLLARVVRRSSSPDEEGAVGRILVANRAEFIIGYGNLSR